MDLSALVSLIEVLSDTPVSVEEMKDLFSGDSSERKCNIVFPF